MRALKIGDLLPTAKPFRYQYGDVLTRRGDLWSSVQDKMYLYVYTDSQSETPTELVRSHFAINTATRTNSVGVDVRGDPPPNTN